MRVLSKSVAAAGMLMMAATAASGASFGSTIQLQVPVICKVVRRGDITKAGNTYNLGQLFEYCNAPGGFLVQVQYQPGTLRGAVIRLGDQEVTLDGSGETQVMRSNGPRISTMDVSATAGEAEVEDGALQFQIVSL